MVATSACFLIVAIPGTEKVRLMNNEMIPAGSHESAAIGALHDDRTDEAQVHALLALASAVDRLAAAHEDQAVGS
ncbi:hypothetical protein ACFQY7_17990 [Actinomadura luteofluorescens]|uniref:Uncharacterized protein n=2 Tax=Actinomadura luteofluorescens TaxID=46163 RepID=A0A7Y9EQ45_9ACTN|nr:hypothetical protein [Actinomadura luteofluorescens]